MMDKEFTPEQIEWLKENYPKISDHKCRLHLKISYKRLWMLAEQLGLQKEKPTELETEKKVPVKTQKKRLYEDENAKDYCIDCTRYRYGGICEKTGKWVGALWMKKCFKGEV